MRQKPTPAKSEIFGRRNWGGLRGIWSWCGHWLTNTYFQARNGTRFAFKMLKNAPKNAPDTKSEILKKVPKMTKIVEKMASKNGTKFSKNLRGWLFFPKFRISKKIASQKLHRKGAPLATAAAWGCCLAIPRPTFSGPGPLFFYFRSTAFCFLGGCFYFFGGAVFWTLR